MKEVRLQLDLEEQTGVGSNLMICIHPINIYCIPNDVLVLTES